MSSGTDVTGVSRLEPYRHSVGVSRSSDPERDAPCLGLLFPPPRRPEPRESTPALPRVLGLPQCLGSPDRFVGDRHSGSTVALRSVDPIAQRIGAGTLGVPALLCLFPVPLGLLDPCLGRRRCLECCMGVGKLLLHRAEAVAQHIGAGTLGVPALLCPLCSGFCGPPIGIRRIRPGHRRINTGVRCCPRLFRLVSSRSLSRKDSL